MKYEKIIELQIGQQTTFLTADFNKVTAEVLAKRIVTCASQLRKLGNVPEYYKIRTHTIPTGIVVTRIS